MIKITIMMIMSQYLGSERWALEVLSARSEHVSKRSSDWRKYWSNPIYISFSISPDLAQLYQGVVVLLGTVSVCRAAKSPKKTWEHKYQTDISIHHINIYTWSDSSESLVLPPWTTRARPELRKWKIVKTVMIVIIVMIVMSRHDHHDCQCPGMVFMKMKTETTWRVRVSSFRRELRECWENFVLPGLLGLRPPPLE